MCPDSPPSPLPAFLVEDNALIRDNLVVALDELADVQVVASAATEGDAVAWLHTHPRDWRLLVIDLFLAQGSGMGVLRICQVRRPDQRAVVLTNYADSDLCNQCLALGADAVFDKSTELDQFIDFCCGPARAMQGSEVALGEGPGQA